MLLSLIFPGVHKKNVLQALGISLLYGFLAGALGFVVRLAAEYFFQLATLDVWIATYLTLGVVGFFSTIPCSSFSLRLGLQMAAGAILAAMFFGATWTIFPFEIEKTLIFFLGMRFLLVVSAEVYEKGKVEEEPLSEVS